MRYYISDLHLGSFAALEFDDRPFSTVEEQTEIFMQKWNDTVTSRDDVYLLGDILWNNELLVPVFDNLNGRKHLITGNHDRITNSYKYFFHSIEPMMKIKDMGLMVTLCHYPIAHWEGADIGWVHLYGHVHMNRDCLPYLKYKYERLDTGLPYNAYNVGCMLPYMDYQPRPLDYIIEEGNKWEEQQFKLIK